MNITILGAGHFGTVLYNILRAKHHVTLVRRGEAITLTQQDFLLVALPVQAYDSVFKKLALDKATLPTTLLFSKGMNENKHLPSAILQQYFPTVAWGIVAGPNFAFEMEKNLPTASVLASHHAAVLTGGQTLLQQNFWRIYANHDPIGVQLNGVMKNILSIAVGVARGKNLGLNASASLISRGLAEMKKLLLAEKAAGENSINENTCYGLSGVGDLVLTASSELSRNTALGIKLGQGCDIATALQQSRGVAEGYGASRQLAARARLLGVDLPIISTVAAVLHESLPVDKAIEHLLTRPLPASE